MDIQIDVSSQFDFNTVNLTKQSDISSNITNICSKNTTSDLGKLFGCKVSNFKSK